MLSTVQKIIADSLAPAGVSADEVVVRAGGKNAHFSVLLAKMAATTGKSPAEIFAGMAMPENKVVDKVVLSGAYINVWVTNDFVKQWFAEWYKTGMTRKSNGKKVLLEWVSANPTGPIHLGHARGAFLGEALARIMTAAGYDVCREYYVNDFGNQVEVLGRTMNKRIRQLHGETVELEKGEYPGEYLLDAAKEFMLLMDKPFPLGNPKAEKGAQDFAVQYCLKMIRNALEAVGIKHDSYVSEAEFHSDGAVKAIVEEYVKLGATYEAAEAKNHEIVRREGSKSAEHADDQEGGTFLKTSEHGDAEDRIILRADGTPVYLTADLAYHKNKYDRGFDRIVSVFGADHAGHIPRLKAGMALLGLDPNKLETVLVQMVAVNKMNEEGQKEKMSFSKRAGQVYGMDDLVEAIGADAARLYFASRKADTQMVIDLDKVAVKDSHNTTFYLQYAHARCSGVLRKARENDIAVPKELHKKMIDSLVEPEEIALILQIDQFSEALHSAAEKLSPVILNTYFQELAGQFHSYYVKHQVINMTDHSLTHARLSLVAAIKDLFAIGLGLFGAGAPETM